MIYVEHQPHEAAPSWSPIFPLCNGLWAFLGKLFANPSETQKTSQVLALLDVTGPLLPLRHWSSNLDLDSLAGPRVKGLKVCVF